MQKIETWNSGSALMLADRLRNLTAENDIIQVVMMPLQPEAADPRLKAVIVLQPREREKQASYPETPGEHYGAALEAIDAEIAARRASAQDLHDIKAIIERMHQAWGEEDDFLMTFADCSTLLTHIEYLEQKPMTGTGANYLNGEALRGLGFRDMLKPGKYQMLQLTPQHALCIDAANMWLDTGLGREKLMLKRPTYVHEMTPFIKYFHRERV